MNKVDLLASSAANTASVSVNGKSGTCENCAEDAPSFIDLLKNAEASVEALDGQQKQASDAAATPQTATSQQQSLSASVFIALAANDSLQEEGTATDLATTDGEAGEQILDPALVPLPATTIPNTVPKGPDISEQINTAGKAVPGVTPENPAEPTTDTPKSGQTAPESPIQIPSNVTPTRGDHSQGITPVQANDNHHNTPTAPQTTAGTREAEGTKLATAELKTAPPEARIEATANAETRPASGEQKLAPQTGLPRAGLKTGSQAVTPTALVVEESDAPGSSTKEAMPNTQPTGSPAANAAIDPSRSSPLAANLAALNTPATKTGMLGSNTPTIGELTTATGNDDTPLTANTASDGDVLAQNNSQDNGERLASLTQKQKTTGNTTPAFQALDSATQQTVKTSDFVIPATTTAPLGEMARLEGMTGTTPTVNNPALPQVPLNSVAVHIAAQARAGNQQFNIRLDPPELGRIDIRLEIGRDGQTLTHLAVEKPETLDLLRQDSRQLERALQNAGLDTREGGVSFSLKDDGRNKQQGMNSEQDGPQQANDNASDPEETTEPGQTKTMNVTSGLDISI